MQKKKSEELLTLVGIVLNVIGILVTLASILVAFV